MKKQPNKNYLKAVPAWLSLILAAHRVQLVRCPPRITVLVIRSAVNAAMSQARTA